MDDQSDSLTSILASPNSLMESLECPICATIFHDPKQLSCGHTYCAVCINRLIEMSPSSGQRSLFDSSVGLGGSLFGGSTIQCPQCRKPTSVPKNGLNTNFIVKEMVDKMENIGLQAEKGPTLECTKCSRRTPSSEAFLCKTCADDQPGPSSATNTQNFYLCSLCALRFHKDHEISQRDEWPTKEERTMASAAVRKLIDEAKECVMQCQMAPIGLNSLFDYARDVMCRQFHYFDSVLAEINSSNCTPLKADVEDRVQSAQALKERMASVEGGLSGIKEELLTKLQKFCSNIEPILIGIVEPAKRDAIETPSSSPAPNSAASSTTPTSSNRLRQSLGAAEAASANQTPPLWNHFAFEGSAKRDPHIFSTPRRYFLQKKRQQIPRDPRLPRSSLSSRAPPIDSNTPPHTN